MFCFSISREAFPLPADNHVAFLSHKTEYLALFFDSVKNVGKARGFFSLDCCQKACVPVWVILSSRFQTCQHCHFCDCSLSNGTGSNEQEAVQVAKIPFSVFQVYSVQSSSAHSGLAQVLF